MALGLFLEGAMVGLSMGSIKHWYSSTEYYIDELCIKTKAQGKGLGTHFLEAIETFLKARGIKNILLEIERDVPAYRFYKKNGYSEMQNHVALVKEVLLR